MSGWAQAAETFPATLDLSRFDLVVDARDRDAWLERRLAKSVYVNWEVLGPVGTASRGSLPRDPSATARELAAAGLHPDQRLLVVGGGRRGRGNEGRVAWILRWLGFTKVSVASFAAAAKDQPLERGPYVAPAKPAWKPKLATAGVATAKEAATLLERARRKPETGAVVLDVRPERVRAPLPDFFAGVQSYRISWRRFLNEKDVPDDKFRSELRLPSRRPVLVVSHAGLSSALVALILRDWGYDARNLAEGLVPHLPVGPALAPAAAASEGGDEQ